MRIKITLLKIQQLQTHKNDTYVTIFRIYKGVNFIC
jgi:hypothetical protein